VNKHFARRLALAVVACFSWSLALASSARAITARPPAPPSRTRPLSANEMQHILGATIAPVGGDPTGRGSGGSYVNVGTAPGPAYAWEGSVGDVKTDTGNKMTEIPLVGWTARGGLPVGVSLIHNSLGAPNRYLQDGPKWTTNYDSWVSTTDSGSSVTVSWADGRAYTFFRNVDGSYASPTGVYDTLSVPYSGGMDIVTKDQVRYRFNAWGTGSSVTYFLVSVSDENGNTISINRDGAAHIQTIVDPNNRTITLGLDGSGRLQTVTDPMSRQWIIAYDGNGDLGRIDYPALSGKVSSRWIGYNNHNITALTNIGGATQSNYAYNADSTIAWERTPLGSQTSFYYGVDLYGNANALATTIAGPDGFKTTHYYDTQGRLTAITDALGYSQNFSNYDGNNNAQTVQDKRGNYWKYTFDGRGSVLTAQAPPTPENSNGNKVTVTYNGHNKPLTIKAPGGESSVLTYDGNDNLTQVQNKDASNNVKATTSFTVSASTHGLVTDKYDANSRHTHYDYTDGGGNLTAVTTPLGHQTSWTYNAVGAATSRTSPGLNPGSPATITATYGLDEWNRTTSVTYSSVQYGGSDGNKTFAYDLDSNLTDFTNAAGHYTRSYDADGRMKEEDRDGVMQVQHAYDGGGQQGLLSSTTDADGLVTSFAYTHRDELAQSSQSGIATNYQYDQDGSALAVNDGWGNLAAKSWDAAGRLTSVVNHDPHNTYLSGYVYGYSTDSQKTSCVETGYNNGAYAQVVWGYDPLGHLTSEGRSGASSRNATYVVDGVGNRTSQTVNGVGTTYSYDADDELTGDNQSSVYQYDAAGSLTGRRRGGSWIYPYSTNDGQIAVIYTGASAPAYSYGYDALGRRAFRWASPSGGANSGDGVRTDYQYDGSQVLTEKQNGGTVNRYQRGAGGELLSRPGWGGGETPQMDGLGSMRQGLDNGSARFTGLFDYSAFGEKIGGNGGSSSPYGWGAQSGYRQDGESGQGDCGLVLMGARWYDPSIGRFTSRDSDLSQAPYAYCNGDPVNHTDPSGHSWLSSIFKSIGKAVKSIFKTVVNLAVADIRNLVANRMFEAVFYVVINLFPLADLVFVAGYAVEAGGISGFIAGYLTGEVQGRNALGLAINGLSWGVTYRLPPLTPTVGDKPKL